ncbi:DNA glycosylase AlkZ-like family protein [Actinomyces bowdenii]|uniref:Winged helix DNA-binding domain-containing protein n=1 Tax=Actinomyces bowdenii TaxID=131109 RepID=A0A853END0_9ACTO|nr:crosslink repair DNA glycosylase YcaQ family protein [Actinomyces bowdenii]MBF0697629.1 winged helix DNA-binding domain-containing protein [Actinomyces bowdenii]NYS69802.1 winged helix DNA-binding domain-containing protein [Actinomyces bowdenii]
MPVTPALPRQASLARIVSQGLVPATSAPDAVEAVRRQLAIQGQQVSAVPHALLVRSPALGSQVEEAFARGRLVRSWPMRGTVHITTAEDHHWLRAALRHRMEAWTRRSESAYGVDEALCARAAEVALELIAAQGPVPRADLLIAWQEAGLMEAFQGTEVSSYRRRHLLVRLQCEGVLVQGPRRGNEHLVVDASPLPDADSGPAGAGVAAGQPGHSAALAEIARRYATSHGPVSAEDLARWTTLPKRQAAQALEAAVEATGASDYPVDASRAQVPLVRVRAVGGMRGRLEPVERAGAAAGPGPDVLYMRADLLDLLAEGATARAARATHVLGSFDELHVGYKDRSCLTDEAGERLICPSANGMFRPLVVDRGRLVAVRPSQGLIWLAQERPARLERDTARAVTRIEQRLAR